MLVGIVNSQLENMCVVAEVAKAFVSATTTLKEICRGKRKLGYKTIFTITALSHIYSFFPIKLVLSIILFTSCVFFTKYFGCSKPD